MSTFRTRSGWILIAFTATLFVFIHPADSKPPVARGESTASSLSRVNNQYINANYIFMFVTNHGNFGRDLDGVYGNDFGTYYPYINSEILEAGGAVLSPHYASGLWLGGVDSASGDTLVTVSEYSSDYVPGPMAGGTFQTDRPEFRVYKLYSDSLESNPNQDYLDWPVDQGAPVDGDGHPEMRGDQMLWTVFNDADSAQHTNNNGRTAPFRIEVQMSVWAFGDQHPLHVSPIDVHHTGAGLGNVSVLPVRPSLLTGHDYRVEFGEDYTRNGGDWYLIDITLGDTVANPANDGLRVVIEDAGFLGVESWEVPNGDLKFTWELADFGWEGFNGALGWAGPGSTWGPYDPVPHDSIVRVLLKLAPTDSEGNFDPGHEDVSYAYRYMRGSFNTPARPEFEPYFTNPDPPGGSYGFQEFIKNCPLSAWNVDVDPPQRLALGFLESNTELATLNGRYFPPSADSLATLETSNVGASGPREWLWIFLDDYSETPNPAYQLNAIDDPMPIMYWATWNRPANTTVFEDSDEFLIVPSDGFQLSPADTFYFQAPPPIPAPEEPDDASVYIRYKLINKGERVLKDLFAALWTDPDLGTAGDDQVGCDTLENRWFCYNETDLDGRYGSPVPAVGFKLIEGPVVPSSGDTALVDGLPLPDYKNQRMHSFQMFVGGSDPDDYRESYWYMWGLRAKAPGAPPLTYNDDTVTHIFSGDPVTGTGWLDYAGDDRRMMAAFGPFDFRPGDTQQVWIKMAVGEGTDYLSSITRLREILEYTPDITGLGDQPTAPLPNHFRVGQNYPNPFNPSTAISYTLPWRADVDVSVFNILGQKVATLYNGSQPAGTHAVMWNGVDDTGETVATGVYFYRVRAGDEVQSKKMLLLK